MKDKHLYAVILAGGAGTRFWPVSRKKNPKQFLEVMGGRTLLDLTLLRLKPLIASDHVFIVTNVRYEQATKRLLKKFKVPHKNILLEPQGKNTAPAVCWAASRIHTIDPQAVIAVLPSDHLILNAAAFIRALKKAAGMARKGFLVTFGIAPTRPETGYGYLKTATRRQIVFVDKFTEKPTLAKAKNFVMNKNYYWNSGMFVWKTSVILKAFKKYLPKVYSVLGNDPAYSQLLKRWQQLPGISVDYGILEKADGVVAVVAKDLGWSDVGSWESLMETMRKDRQGNVFFGDVINIGSQRTLVYAKDRPIATIGLDHCVIVDTPDALLVCRSDQSQKVKDVVEVLKNKRDHLL
ncbi:MAG TPA: sugar phosphate nucleotidyltransferase [Candidatus Omnitrophota bacterium]|nr:sugar phosphate nucleotidyltransferase [Candidatus Omnitrophota bacterium]